MPIIDPSVLTAFMEETIYPAKTKYTKHFFLRYLKIASRNLYRSPQTIEASIQFKNELKRFFPYLNELFGGNFTDENVLDDPLIKDPYRFLFDHMDPKFKQQILVKQKGVNKIVLGNIANYFFLPYVEHPESRTWLLTNSPIAVLVIKKDFIFKIDFLGTLLTNLEIDLMIGSGFSVVLCVLFDADLYWHLPILKYIIINHPFLEIHFMLNKVEDSKAVDNFYDTLLDISDKINGYFYLYSKYILDKNTKAYKIVKELKSKPRFRFIFTSLDVFSSLGNLISNKTNPFAYYKTGFDDDKLRINLCNVPLFKTENYIEDFLPSEYSGDTIGYISKDDFLDYSKSRVKIIIQEQWPNNNKYIERYVNFDDIHFIPSDKYIYQKIFLAKIDEETIDSIEDISNDISMKEYDEDFKKENIFSLFKEKKFIKGLSYVCYAYNKMKMNSIKTFEIHQNQLLTAFNACQICLFQEKRTNNGVVYQVETGEGKSCIIRIIAAVLAIMKKTVHITSSNITLSNRDYYESYEFFKLLGLSSAVFLHYNELPYVDINNSVNKNSSYDRSRFPLKYFGQKLFKNSLNMNISVCGINSDNQLTKNKANIIFSTLVNFECLYLRMMEMCPAYIPKYFGSSSLIIDEADSILIDELTNGTIISRPIKSNAKKVLSYVYDCRMKKQPANAVLDYIQKTWRECSDMRVSDIEHMYQEIDLINQDEFVDGKKYTIEEFKVKKKKSLIHSLKKSWEDFEQKKEKSKKVIVKFFKDKLKKKKNKNKEEIKEEEEEDIYEEKVEDNKMVKAIVPFDYNNKGILEPNKEFNGFVQQFIAIKEMRNNKENSNMMIKDISMSYLFVSHPIFVNLYDGVVGLTGTIGSKYDKKILREQYNLSTMRIPRNEQNKIVKLPIILCDNINERNKKIVTEVIHFHEKENPVLVIFQDLNEIASVLYLLIKKGIKNVNIFDGKDENIKPDIISGLKGAVSLGTNVCGRGTDIKKPAKPLHVIVTYYSNARVMYQAFGRTARQGENGSVRIICLKENYIVPIEFLNQKAMDNVLDDFKFKNKLQVDFIEKYKKKREWIFYGKIKSQKLSTNDIEILRETKINANRLIACEFEFPICIRIPTFLNIQAQKIFSLFNCPNCKYTWMLFQKYLREMILESWSLFINNSEKNYYKKDRKISYQDYLTEKVKKIYKLLDEYLPIYDTDIIKTFMHIHKKVRNEYENKIMKIFPKELSKFFKQNGTGRFCMFTFGFKPYSLVDKSGAKINSVDGSDQDQNYISDPELKYMKKQPKGVFSLLSITEKIDGIFDWICQKINEVIGCYIGLRFFLRRTLGGCEFGVCLDYDISIPDEMKKYDCLIDQDPLFMFTISVKSMAPVMAGILIIGLVYLASVAASISEWFYSFPTKITKTVVKKVLVEIATNILSSQIEKLCDCVCSFLLKILVKQVDKMKKYDSKISGIFQILMKIATLKDFSTSGDEIQKLFEENGNLNVKSNFGASFIQNNLPWASFVKIGFLIMLCFASFMMNFHLHRQSLKYNESIMAEEYDRKQDRELAFKENKNAVKKEKIGKMDENMDELKLKTDV